MRQAAARTTPDNSCQAIRRMLPLLSVTGTVRAGFVGLCCGGLVEHGADPTVALGPVLERLRGVLGEAGLFAAAAQAVAEEEEQAEIEAGSAVEQFGRQVAREQPPLAWAWSAVDLFGRAAVAMLGRSKPAR